MKTEIQNAHRQNEIRNFLVAAGFADAVRTPIPGDASFRKYERLTIGDKKLILMDAPPPQEDVKPFVKIQSILIKHGYSAPELIAEDNKNGLLLLEDLGDSIYSRLLRDNPADEEKFYLAAIKLLADLTTRELPKNVPAYDETLLKRELSLFTEWFLPAAVGKTSETVISEFSHIWTELIPTACRLNKTLVLRDYHADNLLWLPERDDIKRVGLLDFQDAVIGSPAYDIVSLLEDARRDVNPNTVQASIKRFLELRPEINHDDFMTAYAILGAQRNLKIIGIFTRLCLRDSKPKYLSLLPRVWGHLQNDLQHPLLSKLKKWLDEHAPNSCRTAAPLKGAA